MDQPSFLARKTLGQPNYLLIAMATAFAVALTPYAAREAVHSGAHRVQDWLPDDDAEAKNLAWFRTHFQGDQFIVVSWDGCTLGNSEKLELLARKLSPTAKMLATSDRDSDALQRARWYKNVVTGPRLIDQLTRAPAALSYEDAVRRLEGTVVGPKPRDREGGILTDDARTTCLAVDLAPAATRDNRTLREAIDKLVHIADAECGIKPSTLHLGGPPVDAVAVDAEAEAMLLRMAVLTGVAGIGLCWAFSGSFKLGAAVFAAGAVSGVASLAIVFYFGVVEVLVFKLPTSRLGATDAMLMVIPALAYVLGVGAALHLVAYYRHDRRNRGMHGAAERTARIARRPTLVAAIAVCIALATLLTEDLVPVKRFGLFAAFAALASVAVVYGLFPVLLHRFPLGDTIVYGRGSSRRGAGLPAWAERLAGFAARRHGLALAIGTGAMLVVGAGMFRLKASVAPQLLTPSTRAVRDNAWFERHLGNLAPLEIIVTMPPERLRLGSEYAEEGGQQYRLTMLERAELVREIQRRIKRIPAISGSLSAATLSPSAQPKSRRGVDRNADYAANRNLEQHVKMLEAADYVHFEQAPSGREKTGRQLWRISARIATGAARYSSAGEYGEIIDQVRNAVTPILAAYQQRDIITGALHEQGRRLAGSTVCVLFRAPGGAVRPPAESPESLLGRLLRNSGAAPKEVSYFNLSLYDQPGRSSDEENENFRRTATAALTGQNAVVLVYDGDDPTAKKLAADRVMIVDVSRLDGVEESAAATLIDGGGPRPVRAVFTGIVPVVDRTQRMLVAAFEHSIVWAMALMVVALAISLQSVTAAIAVTAASAFPLLIVFGVLGWVGVRIDLGMMLTASVAIGAAVQGGVHYFTWFRAAIGAGKARGDAAIEASQHCAGPLLQTTLIGGLGLSMLAFSAFTPAQHFGYLAIAMLGAAALGNLALLPAIAASPAGALVGDLRRRSNLKPAVEAAPASVPLPPRLGRRDPGEAAIHPHRAGGAPVDERREPAHSAHAALHAKLQQLRQAASD